jgi:L-fuconolactonase
MFGSDWPACTLAASYSEVLDLALTLLAGRLDPVEVDAVLAGSAARIYRLGDAGSSGSQD